MTESVVVVMMGPGEAGRATAAAPASSPRAERWGNAGLPSAQRRRAETLLDQQFWCWGQDIRHPGGNLLLDYGFDRRRPPAGQRGSSAYTLSPAPGRTLVLWGFGLSYADAGVGALFLPRYGFAPRVGDAAGAPSTAWALEHLPPLHVPTGRGERERAARVLTALTGWVAAYEEWVAATHGLPYRAHCLVARDERCPGARRAKRVPVAEAAAWRDLAALYAERGDAGD